MKRWAQWLEEGGASFAVFDARFWDGAMDIFAPIQAAEAAKHHPYTFQHFEPAIAERLAWGASITGGDLLELRAQMAEFRGMMADLFASCDYLLLPCCPMSSLFAGADHSETRKRILRYTVPMSLAGLPVVALPGTDCGMQLVGPPGSDGRLLALSAALGAAVA
jgi:aspartyl-tRNA(Asn)/glutamyl-tRNA(Gln) amidotransferase subunit A